MAAEFREAPDVEAVAQRLIAAHHPHLAKAHIGYLLRSGGWLAKGREVWGQAHKVSGKEAFLTGLDFVIVINAGVWAALNDPQRAALVDHELAHCRGGEIVRGKRQWYLCGHDVEDFADIIRRHGLWRPDLAKFHVAVEEHEQLSLLAEELSAKLRPTGTEG